MSTKEERKQYDLEYDAVVLDLEDAKATLIPEIVTYFEKFGKLGLGYFGMIEIMVEIFELETHESLGIEKVPPEASEGEEEA